MNETANAREGFVGYEYKDVTVRRDMEAVYVDSLHSFGWQLEGTADTLSPVTSALKVKRNRRINNKAELNRLEREFETHIREVERLEDSKVIMPSTVAYIIGIVGTAFMAGSVFAVTAATPMIALCIILAIPGFVGWAVPYFAFNKLKQNKTRFATPLIDRQYDEIYAVCDAASRLAQE